MKEHNTQAESVRALCLNKILSNMMMVMMVCGTTDENS